MAFALKLNDFPKMNASDRGKAEDSAAYTAWKTKMKSSLQVVDLWKFIDGTATLPEHPEVSGVKKRLLW